jgi:hypothetical protein
MINDAVFLLEGSIVLFINHNQANVAEWKKQRRSRADDHL